jgi:hypothetical protein
MAPFIQQRDHFEDSLGAQIFKTLSQTNDKLGIRDASAYLG